MYPFAALPENLAAFCEGLRRERGFLLGPAEIRDAARALELVPLHDEIAVRDALRPVLCSRWQDAAVFDRAFDAFFYPGPAGVPQPGLPRMERDEPADDVTPSEAPMRARGRLDAPAGAQAEAEAAPAGSTPQLDGPEGDDAEEAGAVMTAHWSPLAADGLAPAPGRVDDAWRAAARALVRRVQLGRARRWRPGSRGPRFDLRRTLRRSLHTGGEATSPRYLSRPRRHPRFVVLVDGSRSMGPAADAALRLGAALASVSPRVEVFTFSTELERVTPRLREGLAGLRADVVTSRRAWGGGTAIGHAFRAFLHRHGARLLGRDTVVVISSDGLDVGDVAELREAAREIHARAAGVVWLNPLLATPGYEPTAAGMRAVRPYVTTLASAEDAPALARLARTLRLRA